MKRVNVLSILLLLMLALLPAVGNAQTVDTGATTTYKTELTWAEGVVGAPGRELAWLSVLSLDEGHVGDTVMVKFFVDGQIGSFTRFYQMPVGRLSIPIHVELGQGNGLGAGIKVYAAKVTVFFRAAGNLVQRNADPAKFWSDADYLPPSDKTVTALVYEP